MLLVLLSNKIYVQVILVSLSIRIYVNETIWGIYLVNNEPAKRVVN